MIPPCNLLMKCLFIFTLCLNVCRCLHALAQRSACGSQVFSSNTWCLRIKLKLPRMGTGIFPHGLLIPTRFYINQTLPNSGFGTNLGGLISLTTELPFTPLEPSSWLSENSANTLYVKNWAAVSQQPVRSEVCPLLLFLRFAVLDQQVQGGEERTGGGRDSSSWASSSKIQQKRESNSCPGWLHPDTET